MSRLVWVSFLTCFDLVNFDSRFSNQLATTGTGVTAGLVGVAGPGLPGILLETVETVLVVLVEGAGGSGVLVVVEVSSSSNQAFFTGSGILLLLQVERTELML